MKLIFALQSTCMEISVSLSFLFVHEPLYQTIVCYNPVFRYGSSSMDHRTIFHRLVSITTCFVTMAVPIQRIALLRF